MNIHITIFLQQEKIMSNNGIITKESKSMGAVLAAAYGDALGWPNERSGNDKTEVSKELRKWGRNAGGRYYPHTETMDTGSYSDDTQLILCLLRSYEHGEKWWDYWTQVELPFWTVYERGGGRATKESAKSWLDGLPPWSKKRNKKYLKSYFEAGGNGVAMRVLPHVLSCPDSPYEEIAQNIFKDGITTHGHPIALTGALAYGYALWKSFNRNDTLAYGQLIEEILDASYEWGNFSDRFVKTEGFEEWYSSAKSISKDYDSIWEKAVEKMMKYIIHAKKEMENASLADDDQLLKKIDCFDSKINGAGTVAAASSIYLASRYATNPINGVVKAAFSIGSDTDTIASMTGGLLGTLCGHHWIFSTKDVIQDGKYLTDISQKILSANNKSEQSINRLNSSKAVKEWKSILFSMDNNKENTLPDGRIISVETLSDIEGKTGRFKVVRRKVQCNDGQSLYISKFSKEKSDQMVHGVKIKLFVDSLEKSCNFYTKCFDMTIEKRNGKIIVLNEGLVISCLQNQMDEKLPSKMALCLQVKNIEKTFKLVQFHGGKILDDKRNNGESKKYFNCTDLDGNRLEISSIEL